MSVQENWEFWVDVGGTFTDCIGRAPDNAVSHCKILSTGIIKGRGTIGVTPDQFNDTNTIGYCSQFFRGFTFRLLDSNAAIVQEVSVKDFNHKTGTFTFANPLKTTTCLDAHVAYELFSGEEAPLTGIRKLMGLRLSEPIPKITLLLGTTLGTNALLERKGAKVALITTKGFADLLEIGTQARSDLFKLQPKKPEKLYESVYEIDERIDAEGHVLKPVDESEITGIFKILRQQRIASIAICLLNAYQNPVHEQLIANKARTCRFEHISVSTNLTQTIKLLDRGYTTVLDAYVSPVIHNFIKSLRAKVMDVDLRIMTSAGSLVAAERFFGKDSILSGPAGGVIGYSHIAKTAGFIKSVGFDMGGTSTDVSRFDKQHKYTYSFEKNGIRIVTPMLEIETIAAGGGSICRFDGQKLTVGPDSAGAYPGPVCYGNGGPLTLTDINLFNQKIDDRHFPLPLDYNAVERKILGLTSIVNATSSTRFSPWQLAHGFTQIANEKMAMAIKKISTTRGYDIHDYTLVSFGGAAGQHACAIAELLGVNRILLNPFSGVLSALGMGMADVHKFSERTVLCPLSDTAITHLNPQFEKLEKQLYREILDEGIPPERIRQPIRLLDLRYCGEESVITVEQPPDSTYSEAFKHLHQQLYGYSHSDRQIEIVTMRLEWVGVRKKFDAPVLPITRRKPKPDAHKIVYFKGISVEATVYFRDKLQPGDTLKGPAIVSENYSTIVIEPGWSGRLTEHNNVVLERQHQRQQPRIPKGSTKRDPIRLELYTNHFFDIASQMGLILQKTALSVNVKERLDFSCAVLDRTGNLVVNAPHIPVHLGAMDETVKALLRNIPSLAPGDVYLTNAPDLGGSHLPDMTVITPIFSDNKEELRLFTASRAHHAEIGGIRPGSACPFAKNLAEEGVVFRNLKVVEKGRLLETELLHILKSGPFPSRSPAENIADIRAAIAANNRGKEELLKLIEAYSWPVINAYIYHIKNAAEQKTRAMLSQLTPGRYAFTDRLDDGALITVCISVYSDTVTVDFTGSSKVNPNCLNATRAIVQSAALYCLRCLINDDIPLNSGVLNCVELILPSGMLNPPSHSDPKKHVAVVGGNVEISQRIVDVIFGALSVCAASQGTMNNLVFGNNRFGYYETICGGTGAGPDFHGTHAIHSHMTNTRITDIEVLERQYPVRIKRFQIRKRSGGPGKYHGGDGVVREIEFLAPLEVSLLTQRRLCAPFGLNGGKNGKPGRNLLYRNGQTDVEILPPLAQFSVCQGDRLVIKTPGGGGYGPVKTGKEIAGLSRARN